MATTIQFKRGTSARWKEVNIVLQVGEPGFVTDENRFKIGDGITPWNDLPYVGESSVMNAQTHYDFPSIGRVNTIYKAESEKKIYQWNPITLTYEVLGNTEVGGVLDIDLINGGNANG
jgi:hypothetical protein